MDNFAITLDIDWAPDFIIDTVASLLRARQVRATWFVTHQCIAVDYLRMTPDLFELGLHPNFLPGSSQGNTTEEILKYLESVVPEANSIRTHGMVQSWPLLSEISQKTDLSVDVSLFLPGMQHIQPIEYQLQGKPLLRVPFFWGDDYEIAKPVQNWHLLQYLNVKGLKVMNFHPIYVYLNLTDPKLYGDLKHRVPLLTELTPSIAETFIQLGEGPRTMFEELIDHLSKVGKSLRIKDIYTSWVKGR